MRRLRLALAVLVLAGVAASRGGATELDGDAMLKALKDGGYVIYLRHDRTDTSRSDIDPIDLNDCAKQRPLSDAGRAHARTIGLAFKAMGIPVDQVFASPVCRSAETATLAFPDIKRSAPRALVYTLALPKEELGRAADELKRMLAMPPRLGTNTVLVGHTTNLKEAAGFWPKHEGGALIFRPDGHGTFALAGSIDPATFERAAN
jgi:phosphohistidine phosphatase SixA